MSAIQREKVTITLRVRRQEASPKLDAKIVKNSHRPFGTRLLFGMVLSLSLASCVARAQTLGGTDIPVPKGAYAVTNRPLKGDSAHQIDFKIKLAFPNSEIADFYRKSYSGKGWHECQRDVEWTSRVERVGEGGYFPIRQRVEYFASRRQKKLLLLTLRYLGKQEKSPADLPVWNHAVQHVTVVLYVLQAVDFDRVYAETCETSQ